MIAKHSNLNYALQRDHRGHNSRRLTPKQDPGVSAKPSDELKLQFYQSAGGLKKKKVDSVKRRVCGNGVCIVYYNQDTRADLTQNLGAHTTKLMALEKRYRQDVSIDLRM